MPSERSSRRRRRGSPANPQPTQRRGSRSAANPTPAAPRRRGGLRHADDRLRPGYSKVLHFDVPIAGGREIISVDRRGERTECGYSAAGGPPIFVALGIDGSYSTDSLRGRFDSIDQLLHAFGACWSSPCEEQKHDLDGFQHLPFHAPTDAPSYAPVFAPLYTQSYPPTSAPLYAPTSATQARSYAPVFAPPYTLSYAPTSAPYAPSTTHARSYAPTSTPCAALSKLYAQYAPARARVFAPPPCKEQHMAQPASAQTLQKLDVLSLEDSNNAPPGCRLSSSPIWNRPEARWGITFYTIRDLRGSFRTYPHVGGPFQSLDEVNSTIDRYLTDLEDPIMCMGLSRVDAIIKRCRYYPDGTKKRGSDSVDKRRDQEYQLARALVDKYNDHHNLFGDLAYEVKKFLRDKALWEEETYRMYFHMNFTAKTKGSDGVDTGSDKLFFAEVTYKQGDDGLTLNSCCILEPSDHGPCYGCGADMKHPNDGNAYAGGRLNISYCLRFGGSQPDRSHYEDSDEEVERLRFLFKDVDSPDLGEELKPVPVPLEV